MTKPNETNTLRTNFDGLTPFMVYWKAINAALEEQGLPELPYGEARDLFAGTWRDARLLSLGRAAQALQARHGIQHA